MNNIYAYLLVILVSFFGSEMSTNTIDQNNKKFSNPSTSLVLLGTIQDAGSPHIGCEKECCTNLFDNPDKNRKVVALGLLDGKTGKRYLFDATPDITTQMKSLKNYNTPGNNDIADAIFLTHAHIGHYTGLMYLGKEARNANNITVYAMPRMLSYLETNGPWSQLVTSNNINLKKLENEKTVLLASDLEVTPFLVPHRDEYSETVGYLIKGPNKSALFIPDIDKWEKWDKSIIEEIKKVDYAFLDATFYSGKEINNRDISQIPHPFITESMEKFKVLSQKEKNKVIFIHFNHTNPVINENSIETKKVLGNGFRIGYINDVFEL